MREDALCSVTERAVGTSPRPQVPNPSPPGAGDTARTRRDGTRRGEMVAVEDPVGWILPPCSENKGPRSKGSGGHLITSRTPSSRAATRVPQSRAGDFSALNNQRSIKGLF